MKNEDVAFHSAKKQNSVNAVQALIKELGLTKGSISTSNKYTEYNFYKLIDAYLNEPEIRLQIHELIKDV